MIWNNRYNIALVICTTSYYVHQAYESTMASTPESFEENKLGENDIIYTIQNWKQYVHLNIVCVCMSVHIHISLDAKCKVKVLGKFSLSFRGKSYTTFVLVKPSTQIKALYNDLFHKACILKQLLLSKLFFFLWFESACQCQYQHQVGHCD